MLISVFVILLFSVTVFNNVLRQRVSRICSVGYELLAFAAKDYYLDKLTADKYQAS